LSNKRADVLVLHFSLSNIILSDMRTNRL